MSDFIYQEAPAKEAMIPIVIGVTGHRDLRAEDAENLGGALDKIFKEFRKLYPATPFILLTSLSEGADRLAAKVAIENGASVIVILPFPVDEYKKDFTTRASIEEFDEILNITRNWFVVPPGAGAMDDAYGMAERVEGYTRASQYIAGHCQVLIALWDGEEKGLRGGTAYTVKCKLDGNFEKSGHIYELLSWTDQGPVYHIVTPRISNPSPEQTAFTQNRYFPASWDDSKAEEFSNLVLGNINSFNQKLIDLFPTIEDQIKTSKSFIIPPDDLRLVPAHLLFLREVYAASDIMALWFQKRRKHTMISLFVLGVCSLLFFELYAHAFSNLPWVLAFYPATLGIACLLLARAKRNHYQDRHLDYRTLAEGLRVQLYWQIAKLDESVSDYYLPRHQGELVWLRYALRNCDLSTTCAEKYTNKPTLDDLGFVKNNWVKDQAQFFSKAYSRDNARHDRQKKWTMAMFSGGLLLAIIFILMNSLGPHNHFIESIHAPLIIIIVLSAAIAAAIEGYAEKMAVSEQAKQYHRMSTLFNDALEKLNYLLEQNNLIGAQILIRELGQEALRENGDWLLMHRERPMKVPITG